MFIPYASKDPNEPPLDVSEPISRYVYKPQCVVREKAYRMFRAGKDTLAISHALKHRETTILRWITAERCKLHNLPNPFGVK